MRKTMTRTGSSPGGTRPMAQDNRPKKKVPGELNEKNLRPS
jgi:hypothetical protein